MAYVQKNNPFPVTGCGRRRSFMTTDNPIKLYNDSPNKKLRKTTRGKGRHFLHADEGGGMSEAGRKAYKKENPGSKLSEPVTEKKPKGRRKKRKDAFCARSRGWKSKRGKAARRRWKC